MRFAPVFFLRAGEKNTHRFRRRQKCDLPQMGVANGRSRVTVPQQFLHFVERVPGIDQKAGEGVPQVMDAHVLQSQSVAQPVPENVDVRERLVRRMAGEQPRAARFPPQGTDDGDGFFGQGNVARSAGFGQGHGEKPLVQTDVFPACPEYFAFACAGEQKQSESRSLPTWRMFQRPHQFPGFLMREKPFAHRADFEGKDARAGRLPGGQQSLQSRKGADALEHGENAVAGGRGQSPNGQAPQP